ncbi:MAG: EamA family transporter [Solirubrobacterales bacterium]
MASRAGSALVVLWTTQWIGLVCVLAAAIFFGLGSPEGADLLYAAGAGVALTVGLGALYQAMVVGTISIAAPVAATGLSIPVVVGLASGDDPSTLQVIGLVAAAIGILLCSREPDADGIDRSRVAAGVGLALLAALGGGLNATGLAAASSAGVLTVMLVQRATIGTLALGFLLASRRNAAPEREILSPILLIGIVDVAATGSFTAATAIGELSLVSVVSAVYPVVTVLLAYFVTSERLASHQVVGAVAALAGVLAIASG